MEGNVEGTGSRGRRQKPLLDDIKQEKILKLGDGYHNIGDNCCRNF
jgi:hypothetical protein